MGFNSGFKGLIKVSPFRINRMSSFTGKRLTVWRSE